MSNPPKVIYLNSKFYSIKMSTVLGQAKPQMTSQNVRQQLLVLASSGGSHKDQAEK